MNENKAEKSLRWIANQIPDFTPKTNNEKFTLAVKLYCSAGAEEISRLTAENAELRARLEKAVELPCRVGDTVYEKGMYEGDVYEHRISKIIFDAEKISFDCTAIGNSIFLTRAAAEARLKELQGGER